MEVSRIGIVGGGQLGRMLAEAALPMGFDVTVVEDDLNCPAAQVDERVRVVKAKLTDRDAIQQLADETDVVTWEIEHIPAGFLAQLALRGYNVQPDPAALSVIQDKFSQKQYFGKQGIDVPVAPFMAIQNEDDIFAAREVFGETMIKTRKGGYDGRGMVVLGDQSPAGVLNAFRDDAGNRVPVYAERKLPFERELSVIAVQSRDGQMVTYPLVQTIHKNNICHLTMAPAPDSENLQDQAEELANKVMKNIDGAGVIAIEAFEVDGKLIMNEIAPRVHNSGHWTIEGAETSQFEQHIRAITGMSLGPTAMRAPAAVMINILCEGERPDGYLLNEDDMQAAQEAVPELSYHLYGKTVNAKKTRKIGHITLVGDDMQELVQRATLARSLVKA